MIDTTPPCERAGSDVAAWRIIAREDLSRITPINS